MCIRDRDYALRISSWKCYRFVEKLLNQYRFTQLQEIFGDRFYFHRSFCENTGGYGNENFRTIIARPFLGPEEHRKLYEWVDSAFFQMEPEPVSYTHLDVYKRQDVLMQIYGGQVSVHVGEGPERTSLFAAWDDDEVMQRIIQRWSI